MSETEIEVLVRVDGELLPLGVEPLADGVPECWVRALVAALRAVATRLEMRKLMAETLEEL